jgi:hypothetical protein
MSNFDAYFSGDEVIKLRSYKEYKLDKHDEDSVKEIEKALDSKKLNSSNKKDSVEYLEHLYNKIVQVKSNEYEYEGDANLNVNSYMEHIKELLVRLRKL